MQTIDSNTWHKKNELSSCEDLFVFHSPQVFVQFSKGSFPDEFGVPLVSAYLPQTQLCLLALRLFSSQHLQSVISAVIPHWSHNLLGVLRENLLILSLFFSLLLRRNYHYCFMFVVIMAVFLLLLQGTESQTSQMMPCVSVWEYL